MGKGVGLEGLWEPEEQVVILGVGNELRGDDGLGTALARRLKGKLPFPVLEGGSAPENLLGKILNLAPDVLVVVDAVDFGGEPGEVLQIGQDEIEFRGFSTHGPSIGPFLEFLRREGVRVVVLGVQPEDIGFGRGLSPPVLEALRNLEELFLRLARRA